MSISRTVLVLACTLWLAACTATPQTAGLLSDQSAGLPARSFIADTPFFPQARYQCGPAALATMLTASDLEVTPDELVPLVYVPERTGSFQTEMTATARSYGRVAYPVDPDMQALLREVAAGNPVLVLQNLGLSIMPQWHFAVVKGFDLESKRLVLNSGEIENYTIPLKVFERTWARADYWGLLILAPGDLPDTAKAETYFRALVELQHSYPVEDALLTGFTGGVDRWPENRNLLMGLGNLLLERGELEQAIAAYDKVVQHYPDYAPAHNNLAQAWLENNNPEMARRHVTIALATADAFTSTYRNTLRAIERQERNTAGR